MISEQPPRSADDLRGQLQAADKGDGAGVRISRSADLFSRRFAVTVAALLAAYLLVVIYLYPNDVLWVDITVTALFVLCMVSATVWHARQRRASSQGWSKRYSVAFAITLTVFGFGMALAGITDSRELWVWLPYAALTATPLLVAALLRTQR